MKPLIRHTTRLPAGVLLSRLHEINNYNGYLPESELRKLAVELDVPLSQIFSVATFYRSFSLEPRGKHTISVCKGTACYIRGGDKILEKLESILGVSPGQTTQDLKFTLETVYCVGSCSMGPVIRVDDDTYGRLKPDTVQKILNRYQVPQELET